MINTLCCWLCRIRSDPSVRLFSLYPVTLLSPPRHHTASLTFPLSHLNPFFPLSAFSWTRAWITSLLWWSYLRRNPKLQSKPSLSLLIRITLRMWHSESDWHTCWLIFQDSHSDFMHRTSLVHWPSINLKNQPGNLVQCCCLTGDPSSVTHPKVTLNFTFGSSFGEWPKTYNGKKHDLKTKSSPLNAAMTFITPNIWSQSFAFLSLLVAKM